MLKALADGEINPAALAALADQKLRATPEQLCDALGACTDLKPVYRRLLKMALEQLQFLEQQISQLDQEIASLLSPMRSSGWRKYPVWEWILQRLQKAADDLGIKSASFSLVVSSQNPQNRKNSSWKTGHFFLGHQNESLPISNSRGQLSPETSPT
jgi:hypothetical protein